MRRLAAPAILAVLLCTAAGATQSVDWAHAEPQSVELSSFKFTPSTLILNRGTAYRLHLSNISSGGHNFAAKEFFAASMIAEEDRGKIRNGAVEVGKGDAVDIRLVPQQAGAYKLHCTHFMHSGFGMTGTITVR